MSKVPIENRILVGGVHMSFRNGAWIAEDTHIGENVVIMAGAVVGRPPISTKALARKDGFEQLPPLEIGSGCVIGSNAVIYRGTQIGENVLIGDTACIREGVVIGDECIVAMGVTINYNTKIGARTKIMDNTHLTGNMVIEEDVFIGMLVTSANDNSMGRERALGVPIEQRIRKGPIIRKHVTIGQGACLLPNIEIGENTIVGANAVVTRSLPPRVVALGVPAKVVRQLDPSEIVGDQNDSS